MSDFFLAISFFKVLDFVEEAFSLVFLDFSILSDFFLAVSFFKVLDFVEETFSLVFSGFSILSDFFLVVSFFKILDFFTALAFLTFFGDFLIDFDLTTPLGGLLFFSFNFIVFLFCGLFSSPALGCRVFSSMTY